MQILRIQSLLKEVPFFSDFAPEQLNSLARAGEIKEVHGHQTLFREGDPADELYLILEGSVRVHGKNPDRENIHLADLKSGQFFGEMALADGGVRSASVQTLENCQFFVLSRRQFLAQVSRSPQLLSEVISAISQKIRRANSQYFEEQLEKQALSLETERHRQQALSRMLTGMTREFSQPLDTVQQHCQNINQILLTLNDPHKARLEEASNEIQHLIGRMYLLVHSFKSITPGEIQAQRETVSWSEFLREVESLYKSSSFRHFNIDLQVMPIAREQPWQGYPTLMKNILMHLLLNVEQHAYPDSQEGQIRIRLEAQGRNNFKLQISDTGAGISPEDLPHVLDPFYTTREEEGCNGMGLTIASNLTQAALGGSLEIQSEPGKGTQVTLIFPMDAPELS